MPFFVWSEKELSLQIEQMDREHQVLIEAMNRLYDLNEHGAPKNEMERAIERLVALTVRHFRNEEYFMDSIGYAKLSNHRLIHEKLLGRLHDYIDTFERGTGRVDEEFFQFLQVWLTAHILGIDKEYASHAHSRVS